MMSYNEEVRQCYASMDKRAAKADKRRKHAVRNQIIAKAAVWTTVVVTVVAITSKIENNQKKSEETE